MLFHMGNLTNEGSTVAEKGQCFDQGARERAVNEAIDLASAKTLRKFLKNLHGVAPNVTQMVEETFLAVEESGGEGSNDDKSKEKQGKYGILVPTSSNRRIRPRYVFCKQCRKEVDVTKNNDTACVWHDGELEIDNGHKTWSDWDEGCHGDCDSDKNRKQYPEAFVWSCCEKDGRGEGCVKTTHKLRFGSSKKTKLFGVSIA